MKLHKTGHVIADTVSDLIGDLPDYGVPIAYGILRHDEFSGGDYFEIDKGFYEAGHYDGNYRLSFNGTQPRYLLCGPHEDSDVELVDWRNGGGEYDLICPPTDAVCAFFGIDYANWLMGALSKVRGPSLIRYKGEDKPIEWRKVRRVITFNSTVGVKALMMGIPVISDPEHSTVGSYTQGVGNYIDFDRKPLFNFIKAHQFKLGEKRKICSLIEHYLSL